MARNLDGMVVAITGASAGIGRALAVELARRGARLALAARRRERLDELNRELGGGHLTIRADVADPADCGYLVQATRARFARLDTLVCNAGFGLFRAIADTGADDWRQLIATNLYGTTDCIRAALPLMRAQEPRDGWRGQVVIVSSCLARRSVPDLGAYAATKAAQLSLAEALRVEERGHAIAVTSVHPVGTETEFTAAAEQRGTLTRGPRSRAEVVQSAETVAAAIADAIARPRPEVWPHARARWLMAVAALMPRVADWMLARHRAVARQ